MSDFHEPWEVCESGGSPWEHRVVRANDGFTVAAVYAGAVQERQKHAERIVACVNACCGLTNDMLNRLPLAALYSLLLDQPDLPGEDRATIQNAVNSRRALDASPQ